MRNVIGWVAVGLLGTVTGCVESNGYPATYGYQPNAASAYYGRPTYYGTPIYQQPVYQPPVYQAPVQTRYVAVPVPAYAPRPAPSHRAWGWRDDDRDGIPNRYDRDRNNDGIPDRVQRQGWRRG